MGISVVLLAYKEAENLRVLLPKIHGIMTEIAEPYEILVIDTEQPTDETPEVCKQFSAQYINQEEPHFGGAFRTGIRYAKMDKFLILDSDGSHDPKYIPHIYQKFVSENCDLVIGSRYIEGGHTDDAKSSIIMSKILNFAFRLVLGIRAKDISTDYRMYHTDQLKQIELKNQNYDVLQEVLFKLKMNKPDFRIGEIPISFQKRIFGESKRKLIPFIIDYIKSLLRLFGLRFPFMRNLILYGIFGLLGAAAEYGTFALLVTFLWQTQPEFANVVAAIAGLAVTFSTNTFLNFRKKDKILFRMLSYLCICGLGIVFSTFMISLLKDTMNLYLLKFVLLIFVSLVQFVLNKYITYR